MIKVIVTAPKGKMDKLIINEAIKRDTMEIVGVVGPRGRSYIGKDVGLVTGLGEEVNALVYDDINEIISKCDIVVDFSTRELSMEVLEKTLEAKKPLICGTTSFSEEELEKFNKASKEIPVLLAANTSRMVNVMSKAMGILANDLKDNCKIEIIDMHDEKKVDAPSGTAKEFADHMSKTAGIDVSKMDFHSVRAGDIPSSHTIIFGGMGERIELTHHSYNWECYAKGACDAIEFMVKKEAGLYEIGQVF